MRTEDNPNGFVKLVRGRGLFCAAEIYNTKTFSAMKITHKLKDLGLLAKPTHENIIRLCPPLVINKEELEDCLRIIKQGFDELAEEHNYVKGNWF